MFEMISSESNFKVHVATKLQTQYFSSQRQYVLSSNNVFKHDKHVVWTCDTVVLQLYTREDKE